ncbi:MAG TPA: IS256 family transposase, partial [Candidatus Binataceae bacterium]
MLKVIENRDAGEVRGEGLLDEIAREGARRMLMAALQAESADYVERHRDARDEQGHALVVRNGRA